MNTKKIFYGWWIVAGGVMIMAMLHPLITTCWGLFVKPVTTDMGFTRSAFGICSTIISGVTVFLSPYLGKWLAQKNTRLIHSLCVIGLAASFASFALAQNITHFYISAFFMGAFSCGAVALPISIVITNWFVKKRGLAISIALAGSGFGGAIISPIMANIILNYGWRTSYLVFAGAMLFIALPMVFVMKKCPEDMGLKAYGADQVTTLAQKTTVAKIGLNITLEELKRHNFFWIYLFGMFCLCFVGFGSLSQLAAFLADVHGTAFAAGILSFFLITVTLGKISLGWVYDKFDTKIGTSYICIVFALSIACMLFPESKPLMYVMAFLYGLGICTGTVCPPVITAAMFGPKHYGEIYGYVNRCVYLGASLSVPAIAVIYDKTGSYQMAWLLCIALIILSLMALLYSDIKCRSLTAQRITIENSITQTIS
ncbi:MFS transporter [Pelosinus sp. sgz500959]|uniref:MFS transporter n=1 Tax=Pelosinus sp. sgz500959 TaxID=3242472 RepID=UPI003672DC23